MGLGDQEGQELLQLARRFAGDTLAHAELEDDRYPFTPWNRTAWTAAAGLGLPGLALPELYGGSGLAISDLAGALEAIARADAGHASVLLTQALARAALIAADGGELAKRWATLRGDGEEALLGHPLYEDPDALDLTVTARRVSGGYVLDGELLQVSCLPVATATLVPALCDDGRKLLFVVSTALEGVVVGEPIVSLGLRSCPTADLTLKSVRVTDDACARNPDALQRCAEVADSYRPVIVALSLGVLRASYELALAYALERRQGKKKIVEHHMVQDMLAGIVAVLDVGTLALARSTQPGAIAHGTELLSLQELMTWHITRAATDGVQLLGGNGYMHDYGQEKHMRDAKQLQCLLGASPTRRLTIFERRLARQR